MNYKVYMISDSCVCDENNNKATLKNWGSREAAINSLETLKGCQGCTDCSNCTDCIECTRCEWCNMCSHCFDCASCKDCHKSCQLIAEEGPQVLSL